MTETPDRFLRQQDLVPRGRLSAMTATVIGVGAIGRQVAIQLAALGCPRLQLIDFDTVEPTNITTQGYFHADRGWPKVDATAGLLWQIESQLDIETINDRFRPQHDVGDAVFCCVDKISTRAAIWRSLEPRCEFWCDGRLRGEVLRILTAVDLQSRRHYAGTLFRPTRPLHLPQQPLHRHHRRRPHAPPIRPLAAASSHRPRSHPIPREQRVESDRAPG